MMMIVMSINLHENFIFIFSKYHLNIFINIQLQVGFFRYKKKYFYSFSLLVYNVFTQTESLLLYFHITKSTLIDD